MVFKFSWNLDYILFPDRYKRAQLALSKGDEDLAKEALKRRKSYAVRIKCNIYTLRLLSICYPNVGRDGVRICLCWLKFPS